MRLKLAALLACAVLAPWGAAMAQVATGYEVRVNPVTGGGGTVYYPGSQYLRVLPQLRQPGDTGAPIHLHMPAKRRAVTRTAETSAAPVPTVKHAPRKAAAPAPVPDVYAPPPLNSAASLFAAPTAPAAAPAPRQQVARAEPPPAQTTMPGLTKRSMILFAAGAPDPSQDSLSAIKFLATDLNAAMTGSARIQLQAFGGAKGDKGSDARRLSLKRALAIRQVLIDDGVASARIDVRAMGGADDSGPADRVDVFVKS